MSKLTPESEKLLRSYKNISKALVLSPKCRDYFDFKKLMTEEELTVLRLLKKELSVQNHINNKINGTVNSTNRGRKNKAQTESITIDSASEPPASSVTEIQSLETQPLDNV
jgi:hypothetical protein